MSVIVDLAKILRDSGLLTAAFIIGALALILAIVGNVKTIIELSPRKSFTLGAVGIAFICMGIGGYFIPVLTTPKPETGTRDLNPAAAASPAAVNQQINPLQTIVQSTSVSQSPTPVGISLRLSLLNGTVTTIEVTQRLGRIDRLVQVAYTKPLPIEIPTGWQWTQLPQPLPQRWDSYQLPFGGREPCPNWDATFNSSSMKFSLNNFALAYAEKSDTYARLVPLSGTGEVVDLDNFLRGNLPRGSGPLNDSIQVFLVPQGTSGTITVWEDDHFLPRSCSLTIGTK